MSSLLHEACSMKQCNWKWCGSGDNHLIIFGVCSDHHRPYFYHITFLVTPAPPYHDCLTNACYFWTNIGIFGPFDLLPEQKTMRTSYLGGLSIKWVPKLLLTPVKIRNFGSKTAKFGQNMHFGSFCAKYWHFLPIWSHAWRLEGYQPVEFFL